MDPLLGASLIAGGSNFLGTLADRIFGSGDRKRLRRFASRLEGMIGQDVLPKNQQRTIAQRAALTNLPQLRSFADSLNRRFGLDTGVAQGALFDRLYLPQMELEGDLEMKNLELTQGRDAQLRSLIAQLRSQMAR